jgi:hypothetical protein
MKSTTNNQTIESEEDTGEFSAFDTLDSLAAYVFHKFGEEALRELLKATFGEGDNNGSSYGEREMLEDSASELERRHLHEQAAILREFAVTAHSGIDNVPSYWRDDVDQWRRKWLVLRHMETGELDRELRRNQAKRLPQSKLNGEKPAIYRH